MFASAIKGTCCIYPKMCQSIVIILVKYVLQTVYPDCHDTSVDWRPCSAPNCGMLQNVSSRVTASGAHLALTPDMRTMRAPQRLLGASGLRIVLPVGVDGAGSSAGASLLSSGASDALSFVSFSGCKNAQVSIML